MNNKALIIGGDHYNPLGVIEALGQKGIKSNVIIYGTCKQSFVLKSKFVERGWICNSEQAIVETIVNNFKDTQKKAVAITCSDDTACILNDHYGELQNVLHIPGIDEQGALKAWMDKGKMTKLAASLGMSVPRTWIVKNKIIPLDMEYPCITKPITSVKFGKSDFAICNNSEELKVFLEKKSHSDIIQIQKLIEKNYEFQFLGCSLGRGEVIIIPGDTYIESVTGFTNGTFMKFHKQKAIEGNKTLDLCKKFIKETGYSGLFSVEYMEGKDGIDYFLEMNYRNDGNCAIVTAAGTNLPYIWYLHCVGGDYEKEIAISSVIETYSVPEDVYFINMLLDKISFRQWYHNMKKVSSYFNYFKGDSRPFMFLMCHQKKTILQAAVYGILRRIGLKK